MKKNKKSRHNLSKKNNLSDAVELAQKENSNAIIALAVILLITILAYLPVFHNGLLIWWDDEHYIITNHLIKDISGKGIKAIFSDFTWDIYCPLTFLIHAVPFKIGGLNPVMFHSTSLIFHLLNTALVFWFVKMLCGRWEVATLTALLFGIHPMGVESVAWASAGTNVHCTAFFLGSLVAYLFYLHPPAGGRKRYLFISLFFFILSLLSKAVTVVLPLVLLLIDYYKGRKITKNVLLEKIPFLMISMGTGILTFLLKNKSGGVGDIAGFTLPTRAVFASYGFVSYLIKLVFPLKLCAFYPYPVNGGNGIPIEYYAFMLIFIALAGYMVYTVRSARTNRSDGFTKKIIFGMGFFTISIFLVLQLLPVGRAIMADRYTYIPSIGIFYLAGEGLVYLWNKKLRTRTLGIALLGVAAVFYSVKTYSRCGVWENDKIFWSDVIDKYPMFATGYYNRGCAYMNEKRPDEAIKDFNKAIELKPDFMDAYLNRGLIYMNEHSYDEAIKNLNKAIEINPGNAEVYYNRGSLFVHKEKYTEAINDLNKAIELRPDFMDAYINRGLIYMNENRYDEAIKNLNKAIEINPGNAESYLNRGNIYFNEKRNEEAISDFKKVIELNPGNALAWYNMGISEYQSGNKDAACKDLMKAAGLGFKPAAEALSRICK